MIEKKMLKVSKTTKMLKITTKIKLKRCNCRKKQQM